jgi:hypothetical protein
LNSAGSVLVIHVQKTYGGVSRFGEQKQVLNMQLHPAGKAAYESEIEKKRKQQARNDIS